VRISLIASVLKPFAAFAPAMLVAAWLLVAPSDEPWPVRVIGALLAGAIAQFLGVVLYGLLAGVVANFADEKFKEETLDLFRPHTATALLLAAVVYVTGQYWKHQATSTIRECVRSETGNTSTFGQFENARDLFDYCAEEYGKSDSFTED